MFYSSETTTSIAICVLTALILLFAPSRLYQRPKAGEPPLTAGFLPWLGVGLSMRDMDNFLRRNFAKHGPTFTAYATGKRLVFTKDVVLVRHMVSNSSFADTPLADSFELAFLRTERPVFKQEAATCHRLLHSTMAGRDLFDLRDHFLVYFEQALEQCRDGEVDFFTLVREMVFCSISRAIFGPEFPAAQIMTSFFSWDDNFKGIMTGIGSRSSIRKGHADREKVFTIVSRYLQDHLAETAPTIRLQVEKLTSLGASWDLTVRAVALRLLWAGTANSTPVAVWAAAFVYKDQGLAKMLRDELAHADSSYPLDERLPSAQCIAEEANRLSVFGSIVRPVLRDTSVPTAEGGRLYVRKGDIVLGQCREMHRAFDRPEEFIFDRVKKARQADKANLGYIPFAGGKGICPGRFLAYSEIKIVVLAMLQTFDLEPLSPFPELSPEGILGFGIAKPSRPWYVKLRRCTKHA